MENNFLKIGDTWVNKKEIIFVNCPCGSTMAELNLKPHKKLFISQSQSNILHGVFNKELFPKEYSDICRYVAELENK